MGGYGLMEKEWQAIKPHLPNKSRGVSGVHGRRDLNGIYWVLRSSAFWSDVPDRFGPPTTICSRFNRWRKVDMWDRLINANTSAHDEKVQLIDTSKPGPPVWGHGKKG